MLSFDGQCLRATVRDDLSPSIYLHCSRRLLAQYDWVFEHVLKNCRFAFVLTGECNALSVDFDYCYHYYL